VAYVGSSKSDALNTTANVAKPAGTLDGHHVTLWAITDNSPATITWPTGFVETSVTPITTAVLDNQILFVATKIASAEPATWDIVCTQSIRAGSVVHSGRNPTTPIHRISGRADTTNRATPWTATSNAFSSPTALGDVDLIFIQADDVDVSGVVTHTAPTGFTLRQEHAGADFRNGGVSTRDAVPAGETGVYSGTGALATASTNLAIVVIALASAGVSAVQSNRNQQTAAATSISVALPNPITNHANIVIAVTWGEAGAFAPSTVGDGTRFASPEDVSWDDAGEAQNIALYSLSDYAGGSPTFTASFPIATSFLGIAVIELTPSTLDHIAAGISGTSTTPTARSITPSVNGCCILAMFDCGAVITPTAPFKSLANDSTLLFTMVEGYTQETAAAIIAACSQASSQAWGAIAASYKPSVVTVTPSIGSYAAKSRAFIAPPIQQPDDLDFQYQPHVGGRYHGNLNFSYGALPYDSGFGYTPGADLVGGHSRMSTFVGTDYSGTVDGGFTPAGALTKVLTPGGLSQTLSGGFTPAGALQKQINRLLAGGFTPGGALTKLTNRILAGGFTPAGALTWSRQYFRTLAGGFTPNGALTKLINRILAGGFAPSATVTKQTSRTLTGGSVPSGSLTKRTFRTLAGGIVPSGTLQKLVARILAGAVTFTGVLTKTTVYLRTFAGGFTPGGALTKQVNRTVAGAAAPSGALTKRTFRNLAGSLVPSGTVTKFLTKILSGSVVPAGALTKLKAYFKTLTGALAPSGTVQRQTARATQGGVIPSGTVSRLTFRALAAQIGLSGQISRIVKKNLGGLILPTGVLTWFAIAHDFLILLAGTEGARYILGALSAIRYRLENRSESRYGPSHTGEASDELDNNSTSKDDL
jgi:hypothetical protein